MGLYRVPITGLTKGIARSLDYGSRMLDCVFTEEDFWHSMQDGRHKKFSRIEAEPLGEGELRSTL